MSVKDDGVDHVSITWLCLFSRLQQPLPTTPQALLLSPSDNSVKCHLTRRDTQLEATLTTGDANYLVPRLSWRFESGGTQEKREDNLEKDDEYDDNKGESDEGAQRSEIERGRDSGCKRFNAAVV